MLRRPLGFLACVLLTSAALAAIPEILQTAPKDGDIPYGKVVYVDDGTCPKGQVKELTGGSREKAIPRRSRCVKRPTEAKKSEHK